MGEVDRDNAGAARAAAWSSFLDDATIAHNEQTADAVDRFQCAFARRGDGRVRRAFHVKSHLALAASFTIADDVPEHARIGLFARARAYPALVRITNGFSNTKPDWFPDLLGMAVRITGLEDASLPGEAEPVAQDLLTLNQSYLPVDDGDQLRIISLATANLLTAPFKVPAALGLAKTAELVPWLLGWALRRVMLRSAVTETYHALVPISIGPQPIKFMWVPRQQLRRGPLSDLFRRNHLRDDARQRLSGGPILFDFFAQFHVDDARTPVDGAYAWPIDVSPPVRLGTLAIEPCDLDGEAARRQENEIEQLAFNPWRGLRAHQPVGNIQRMRGLVYQRSAKLRGSGNHPA